MPYAKEVFFLALGVHDLIGDDLSSGESLMRFQREFVETYGYQFLLVKDEQMRGKLYELPHNLMRYFQLNFFDQDEGDPHCCFDIVIVLHFFLTEIFQVFGRRIAQ